MAEFDAAKIEAGKAHLEHYGRKNMKWGEHIFGEWQSHAKYAGGRPDPSKKTTKSSDSGKTSKKSSKSSSKTKTKSVKKEKKESKLSQMKKQAAEKRRQEILKDPTKLYKYRNQFTKEEINTAMETFEWEKKLRGYSTSKNEDLTKTLEQGKRVVESLMGMTKAGIGAYNQVARIVNTFGGDGEIPYIEDVKKRNKDQK